VKPLKVRRSLETIEIIGAAMGLGFVSGLRLYATVLVLGLLILSGAAPDWMTTGEAAALSNPWVLLAAGAAALAEFIADKVPWFDTVWDSFHSVIRPIGASILAAETFGSLDPVLKLFTVLLCGGMAITSHGSKAASRLIVNHSPEPFSNIVLSLFEDVLVPGGVWLDSCACRRWPFGHGSAVPGVTASISPIPVSRRAWRLMLPERCE